MWLLDLGLSWHQLTGSFSDYLRLATVHLGLLQWHYALTTNRLSPQYEVCSNTFSGIYYWVNSPIKDNPRIVDKGPCTNLSFIRRFHCISSIYAPQAFYWRDYVLLCVSVIFVKPHILVAFKFRNFVITNLTLHCILSVWSFAVLVSCVCSTSTGGGLFPPNKPGHTP